MGVVQMRLRHWDDPVRLQHEGHTTFTGKAEQFQVNEPVTVYLEQSTLI